MTERLSGGTVTRPLHGEIRAGDAGLDPRNGLRIGTHRNGPGNDPRHVERFQDRIRTGLAPLGSRHQPTEVRFGQRSVVKICRTHNLGQRRVDPVFQAVFGRLPKPVSRIRSGPADDRCAADVGHDERDGDQSAAYGKRQPPAKLSSTATETPPARSQRTEQHVDHPQPTVAKSSSGAIVTALHDTALLDPSLDGGPSFESLRSPSPLRPGVNGPVHFIQADPVRRAVFRELPMKTPKSPERPGEPACGLVCPHWRQTRRPNLGS